MVEKHHMSNRSREMLASVREETRQMGERLNESVGFLRQAVERLPRQA